MSKNRNRAKLNKAHNQKEYRKILLSILYPPYFDDGYNYYPKYRAGFKNPQKRISPQKVREYKSWKHNRKKQYQTQ